MHRCYAIPVQRQISSFVKKIRVWHAIPFALHTATGIVNDTVNGMLVTVNDAVNGKLALKALYNREQIA